MKVAIFHTEFAYSGGAEKLIFRQIDYLKSKGYRVDCFASFVDKENCYPDEIDNYEIKQILPERLNGFLPHDVIVIATIALFPLYAYFFRNYDVFLGENQAGPWLSAIASFLLGRPYVTYQPYPATFVYPRKVDKKAKRNSFVTELLIRAFKPLLVKVDKFVIRSANARLANGEYAKEVLEKVYAEEFINCPAGVKRGTFNEKVLARRFAKRHATAPQNVRLSYILITNRHFPAKRLDYGVKVIKKVNRVNLVITGAETDYTQEIKELAKQLKVEDRVIFTGLVGEKKLKNLYQKALVYIYTAPEEDFGMGIIEAMASGVPVVAWDNAGPGYIVEDSVTGFLAKPGDLNGFAAKTKRLIGDRELNFKMASKAFSYTKGCSWQKHGSLLEETLKDAQIYSQI